VDVTGAADPAQMGSFEQASGDSVAAAKSQAGAQASVDFGENNIFPAAGHRILKAKASFATPQAPAGKSSGPLERR
jgi:hypothetical protein